MTPEEVEKSLYGHLSAPVAAPAAPAASSEVDPSVIKHIEDQLYQGAANPVLNASDYQVKPDYTLHKVGAGVGAGLAGRAALDKFMPGATFNPEITKQAETLPQQRENVEMLRDVYYEQQALHDEAVAEHERKLAELRAKQREAEMEHRLNQQRAEAAAHEHAYTNTLTPEDILKEQGHKIQVPNQKSVPAQPTEVPIGGSGTASYAEKFGATPEEARRVPSMSVMQQQNIPQQAQAWEKIGAIAPNFQQYAESPLLLGPEGKQALEQRMQQTQANEALETLKQIVMTDEEKAKHHVASTHLSKRKAESKIKAEAAHQAAKESHENVQEIKRLINRLEAKGHGSKQPASAELSHQERMLQELEDRVKRQFGEGRGTQILSFIGKKALPRFAPYAGSAFAPLEAEHAVEEWKKGNKAKAAAYGLGALGGAAQATGIPWVMGAGDIAQIPAIAIGLDEALSSPSAP